MQAATSEAVRLLASRPNLTIGAARDVRPLVNRATLGAILSAGDLVDILGTIDSARTIRELLHRGQLMYPELATYVGRLHPLKSLRDHIAETINEHGEVVDSASPQLAHLRREVRSGRDRIMRRLEAIIADPNNAEAIQEPIVTERNGRYVIAVKAAHRHGIRGVVHDQSESGATLFLEPLATVDMTNDWRQSQLEEQKEVERILRLLSNRVALEAKELDDLVAALAALDATFAKARYAERLEAVEPDLNTDGLTNLVDARHPLLSGPVVPQTIRLGESFRVLIITGPNTGGKTVALKTMGLLTLMAQCGLRIPAASGSKVAVFEQVLADIGDEQSIEQSLSTFSGHLRNIVAMLGVAGPKSLVLMDELGAGTDPDEGSELARAILEHLLARGVSTIATTHYSALKTFAHDREGVENASVEFNVNTLSPTYRLRIGTPGRSNALAIASRLGLPSEIVDSARGGLSEEHLRSESLLEDIHRKERVAARDRNRATRDQQQQRRLRTEAAGALADAERIRQEARETAYAEADAELTELRRETARLARDLERARQDRGEPAPDPWLQERRERLFDRLAQAHRRADGVTARSVRAEFGELAPSPAVAGEGWGEGTRQSQAGAGAQVRSAQRRRDAGRQERHRNDGAVLLTEDSSPRAPAKQGRPNPRDERQGGRLAAIAGKDTVKEAAGRGQRRRLGAQLASEELHGQLVEARRRGDRQAARALQAQLAQAVERERLGGAEPAAPQEAATVPAAALDIVDALALLDDEALASLRDEVVQRAQHQSRQTVRSVGRQLSDTSQRLERLRPARPVEREAAATPIVIGQHVRVPGFSEPGQVLNLPDGKGELEVQLGAFRIRVRATELQRAPKPRPHQQSYAFQRAPESFTPPSLSRPVDMRGVRAGEVEPLLDRELNEAFSAGVQYLKIIHGHGTGAVRKIVREYLAAQPYVSSYEPAPPKDGGDGATMVTLAI